MKKEFLFGVSTAAFQIEGDDGTQGRGKSVWDSFCERKGNIFGGHNAKVATDHYNRYREDIRLMGEMGANAYRFSTSWSRVLPDGIGRINQKGIDFYDRLIDEMLAHDIQPFLTLYHWDLPQALSDQGGFQNRDFPKWFAEYTHLIVDKFGDRINSFITFNEPINAIHTSYYAGIFPPAYKLNEIQALKCIHHMLLAHGMAAEEIIRRNANANIGLAMSTFEEYPLHNTPENIAVTRKLFFEKECPTEALDVYLDPLYFGKYPQRLKERYPEFFDYITEKDLEIIKGKTNIIGYNNYSGHPIDEKGIEQQPPLGAPDNEMGGYVDPNGLYWGIKFLRERYNKPVYITENGLTSNDWLSMDGTVHDPNRIEFFKRHLAMIEKLDEEGEDVRGWFVWSFLDNFEWKMGYSKRFGVVYVDYITQRRIPKDSYYWLKNYISNKK